MNYKVNFDSLDTMFNSVKEQSQNWQDELTKVGKKVKKVAFSPHMSGQAAVCIGGYMTNVHELVLGLLSQLIVLHQSNCLLYKQDYQSNIDTSLHAVIRKSELEDYKEKVESTRKEAISIEDSLGYVLSDISDLFRVSYKDVSGVDTEHKNAKKYLTNLDEDIEELERNHLNNDFINTGEMIETLKQFINEQLSYDRNYRTTFTKESLAVGSYNDLYYACVGVSNELSSKEEQITLAIELENKRQEDIKKEEQESRKWIKWVAVGIAAVGSIALIVVTAGGATPLVCAGVGAAVGVTSAAANSFADNYIENGSLTEGMDWSEFGKDCLIGGVTGAISGYLGATSVGSAIKQPVEKALFSAASSVVENAAGGVINMTWDVGEAMIAGKPGEEIMSILEADANEMMKDIVVDGATSFVGDYVGASFDVKPGQKGFWKSMGEDTVENAAKAVTENGVESVWDVGQAFVDPERTDSMMSVLKQEGKEFLSGTTGDFVEGEVSSLISNANDAYDKSHKDQSKYGEVIDDILADTVAEGAGKFTGAASKQGVEVLFGDRKDISVKEIWDEDMDGGRIFVKKLASSGAEHISDAVLDDKSFAIDLKKKDYDGDGKVEVVVFDKYMVLKEDYEAAREVAGKGAYKDMSAQDILGLPKRTKISEDNVTIKKIAISRLEESDYKGRKETNVTKIGYASKSKKK